MPLFRELLGPDRPKSSPASKVQSPSHFGNGSAHCPPQTQQPITGQPSAGESMALPQELCQNHNFPRAGLECLNSFDQLHVKQETETAEILTGFETANKYAIKNATGQIVFYAVENSDGCERCMFGSGRSLLMKIIDTKKHELIQLNRPVAMCSLPESMEVSASGEAIGTVQQEFTFVTPKFNLRNESGEILLIAKGPAIVTGFGGDVEFQVYSKNESTQIGSITKKWGGFTREAFTDADNFGIKFPLNLNAKYKALLLATCFLVDLAYYDSSN